ncbi:MAG: glycerophosphodiester phosphodiesterase [Chloroflexota bacterium]|nr:glycerophosphodiester phosphodiesterase [Chloroflexota bacterium]
MASAAPAEVIAHRGASAYAPEHTLAAYDLALEQGAEALELDVRATADGELLVVHDATLLRTALDPRRVSRLTRVELMALDPLLRPLTLDTVLERYGRHVRLFVELKDPARAWEQRVVTAIARYGLADQAIVQSFDTSALRRLHGAAPWLAIAPLYRFGPATARRLRAIASYATGIGVWHASVDAALVLRAHAAGVVVRAWTVNSAQQIARLLALGVDGIITDAPDVARAVVGDATAAAARAA